MESERLVTKLSYRKSQKGLLNCFKLILRDSVSFKARDKFLFPKDNAACHMSNTTTFRLDAKSVANPSLPVESLNINPIENL